MNEFNRPTTQAELDEREAAGFWKAIRLVSKLSKKGKGAVDFDVINDIHRAIFVDAIPEIAGQYRISGEDIQKLHHLIPPPGSAVAGRMREFRQEFKARLAGLPTKPKTANKKTFMKWAHAVIELAAWTQHSLVAIHPFSNGNGRTARLFANLILQGHGLPGSRVKFEQEDKTAYLCALEQADRAGDLEPLTTIMIKAMQDQMKEIADQKRAYWRSQKGKRVAR